MLHEFIGANREEIIERCRVKAASRMVTPLTGPAMEHGVPVFLDQLANTQQRGLTANREINQNASRHGHDLLGQGFSLSQVVHDYGDVCQVITELAVEARAPISTDDLRVLNRCLDDAIAGAVGKRAPDERPRCQHLERHDRRVDQEFRIQSRCSCRILCVTSGQRPYWTHSPVAFT